MSRPDEYYFKEGCFIEEWHNSVHDEPLSVARVRVQKSETTKLHALKSTTERYVILEGTAIVTVAEKSWPINEGDVVTILPDQPQKIQNTGESDLVFLAICTPRFDVQNYQEL